MTLRDFLKANGALIKFKTEYHEQSKIKITYRQIEANLLTAGKDFIINALNISTTDRGYWANLNTKWNTQLKSKTNSENITFDYWLKTNKLKKKFKNAFLRQHTKEEEDKLNRILVSTDPLAISNAFIWCGAPEGYDFWYKQHIKWKNFCKNK